MDEMKPMKGGNMTDRILIDLYSCQGGATWGYRQAGFTHIIGIDIDPQPRYIGDDFHQADAITWVRENMEWVRENATFIHASPPCQHDSECQRIMDREHPDLIAPTRAVLEETGVPWVIENVAGARPKLRNPIELCGTMFAMERTYRHRYFEAGGWSMTQPMHPRHTAPQAKMGRRPLPGDIIHAVGNFSGVGYVREDWGVPWMNRDGIREAIPPAYAHHVGREFLALTS